jgi:transglutaminase-like putative cysteine protease
LRIETIARLPGGQKIEGTVWCDATGDILKNFTPMVGLEIIRSTQEEAMKTPGAVNFDLFSKMLVHVDRPLERAHQTKKVRYRVRLDRDNPAEVFPVGPTQAVRSIDAHTAELTVYAVRPDVAGNADAPAGKTTDGDLRPNTFIQSEDSVIVADAKKAAGSETDPWRTAVLLERFVRDEVKNKNYSQAFATAAEVARSREGDCTEHGVFLAALARARKIPARIAVGLVYVQDQQSFFYHLWTEVHIGGRWIPIDGTLGLGGIGAGHLKIAQSNFQGASVYDAFAPVVRVCGQLHVEILEAQ